MSAPTWSIHPSLSRDILRQQSLYQITNCQQHNHRLFPLYRLQQIRVSMKKPTLEMFSTQMQFIQKKSAEGAEINQNMFSKLLGIVLEFLEKYVSWISPREISTAMFYMCVLAWYCYSLRWKHLLEIKIGHLGKHYLGNTKYSFCFLSPFAVMTYFKLYKWAINSINQFTDLV